MNKIVRNRRLIHGRRRTDQTREVKLVHLRQLHSRKVGEEATHKVLEMQIETEGMLEEERRGLKNHANYELNTQKNTAASPVQNFEQQIRHQHKDLSSRHDDCEASRTGHLHLLP